MVSPMGTLRRRAIRRPRYIRDDLQIEVRDDKGEISSDDEDSPSPKSTTFPPGARPTAPPPPPAVGVAPPAVLNPANPTDTESSTSSDSPSPTSTEFPRPTEPPRGPQRGETGATPFSSSISTTTESSSSTKTLPTAIPNSRSTTSFDSQPTGGTTRGGNETGLGNDRSDDIGWTPTAIAFGTIAIAALFLVIGVGIWWCLRYRKRRQARHLYERSISPDNHQYWDPSSTFSPPTMPAARPSRRSPSSIFAELMGHAYAAENGSAGNGTYGNDRNSLTPQGYLDEKRYDPARQLPILEPAPVAQPNVRNSIASWIRRHHPLKLNPMSGRSSMYSTRSGFGASTNNVNAPPVPNVPDAYRSTDQVQQSGLTPPPQQRYAPSSQYDTGSPSTDYNTNSLLSLYQTQPPQQPGQQQAPAAPWLQDPPPVVFGERGVSMAPTEATESTWRSWGGGVNNPPQHQQQAPPETPRKGWIEKCIKFGGLK
ncbi:hypothetical protein CaCOL14_000444 [Colletotrichum acutatum]